MGHVARSWAAPSAMFNGDSGEWAARLRDMGLFMAYGTAPRNLVGKYINSRQPHEYMTRVDKVGWRGPVTPAESLHRYRRSACFSSDRC